MIEFANYLPGPLCAKHLADLGADVTKIEPPGGDPYREFGPRDPTGRPIAFEAINAGKELVRIDAKTPEGAKAMRELTAGADVFIDGFRPGVAARLGLSFEELAARSHGLIYCSITGFGQWGSRRDQTGHDATYAAVAGVLDATRATPDSDPVRPGLHAGDHLAASMAALSIVAELARPERRARELDVSITDVLLAAQLQQLAELADSSRRPGESSSPENGLYRCSDGRFIALAAVEPHYWRTLCELLGLGDMATDRSLGTIAGRRRRRAEVQPRLAAALSVKPRDEWVRELSAHGVPCAAVASLADTVLDGHFAERALVRRASGQLEVDFPVVFSD